MIRRRAFVLFSAAAAIAVKDGLAGEFWSDKKSSEWSDKDVKKILTRSPWAKEVTIDYHMAGSSATSKSGGRGGRGGGGGGMGGGGMDSDGLAGGGGGGGRGAAGGAGLDGGGTMGQPEHKALVRWESAKPIRDAGKREIPKALADRYIVSVIGLMSSGRPEEGLTLQGFADRLKEGAQLQRKGADPIHPAQVQTGQTSQGPIAYFLFPKGTQPIQSSDKEVTFHLLMGRLEVKAKFALKDMVYEGELAL